MATKAPRKQLTSAELLEQVEATKRKLAALEQRAYAQELNDLISTTNIVADFKKVRHNLNVRVPTTAILIAIAEAVGLKYVQVKQLDPPKRKPKDPTKTAAPRAASKSKNKTA